jgi:hypothetical protein
MWVTVFYRAFVGYMSEFFSYMKDFFIEMYFVKEIIR